MIDASAVEVGRVVFDVLVVNSFKAVALISLVWLTLLLVRPQRPTLTHGVWTAVLFVMLLTPMLGSLSFLPELSMGGMPKAAISLQAIPVSSTRGVVAAATSPSTSLDWRSLAGLLSVFVTSILLLGSLFVSRRLLGLIRRADPVDQPGAKDLFRELSKETGLPRSPRLVSSPEIGTPAVFGHWRPTVILPAAWQTWSCEKLHAVFSHELAHVARRDGWTLAAASLNAAVFWFHPLSWWLRAQIRTFAEMACDDHAIMVVRDPEGYAETLLEIAELRRANGALPATASTMARNSRVTRRIERILQNAAFHSGILGGAVRRRLSVTALSAAILLSVVSVTRGQSDGVTLSGSVQDASGARVPGATVLIVDPALGNTEATTAGEDGTYRLAGLPPSATYEIEVQARGFAIGKQTVDLTTDKHIDITLEVGRIEEVIVIAGTRRSDSSPEPPTPSRTIQVGGNVEPAKLVQHIRPIYPADAEREGVEGTVLLEAVISQEGDPVRLNAVNAVVDQRLVSAAMEAVRLWRYEPALLNGKPVEVMTTVNVTFRLP